ncbi:MAG: hypothetical protein NTW14_08890 [bacterium]|nr:hypothetical protein [bacterium]
MDKVQRKKEISKAEHLSLKKKKLVEGRYPNLFVSSVLAIDKELKAKYLKNRGLNKTVYQNLIIDCVTQFGSASREDINEYILEMLPKILTEKQKRKKIDNLLGEMSRTGLIVNQSKSRRFSKWVIAVKKTLNEID